MDQATRAHQGRSFNVVAAEYERGRPGWPTTMVDRLATVLDLPASATVLDLGAGTGKLTRVLVGRFARVVAVEPLPAMRSQLVAQVPQAEVYEGSAERIPLPDGSVDAVFVADAFHWFDWPAALAEIARVTGPAGRLVLLWHGADGPWEPALPESVRERIRHAAAQYPPGGVVGEGGVWRQAFTGSAFGPLVEESVPYEFVTDREGVIANLLSLSTVARLPEAEREALQAELATLPETTYRRKLPIRLYWTRKRGVPTQPGHRPDEPASPQWCDRCGGGLAEADHTACQAARAWEPPRFCPYCRRRMKVQVLPAGWRASCVAHGETRAG